MSPVSHPAGDDQNGTLQISIQGSNVQQQEQHHHHYQQQQEQDRSRTNSNAVQKYANYALPELSEQVCPGG